jgi:uncharacterized protein YeaO (DUF488 family)
MSKCLENIHTKRVYDPPDQADGTRLLVDRLWPSGLRKESIALTLWLKKIAPGLELRRWFGHDPAHWAEFGRCYRAELALNDEAVAGNAGGRQFRGVGQRLSPDVGRGPRHLLAACGDSPPVDPRRDPGQETTIGNVG